jgi:hypothetical protein
VLSIYYRRTWAMPNKSTFIIKPIRELINFYLKKFTNFTMIDPFAGASIFTDNCVTNDLNPEYNTDYNLEALEFLNLPEIRQRRFDIVFFDPFFSLRQLSELYKSVGKRVYQQTTSAKFYSDRKNAIAKLIRSNGIVISCGWNSNGLGKKNGFENIGGLIVAHGGSHYDTIVSVERKKPTLDDFFIKKV